MSLRQSPVKLNPAIVRRMRLLHSTGKASVRDLALEYHVAFETVRKILRWESWASVGEEGPGATHEDWATAAPQPSQEEIEASRKRLEALLAGEPSGAGLARLQHEAREAGRGNALMDELAGHSNVGVVAYGTSPTTGEPTDGGSKP